MVKPKPERNKSIPSSYERRLYPAALAAISQDWPAIKAVFEQRMRMQFGLVHKRAKGLGPTVFADNRFVANITACVERSANMAFAKLRQEPADTWDVRSTSTYQAIEQAAFALCETTRKDIEAETSQEADAIIEKMRSELLARQQAGETMGQAVNRLSKFFSEQARWKARRIARTESARSHNYGYLAATETMPEVVGYEWSLSDDACPRCVEVGTVAGRGRRIKKGDAFISGVSENPFYSTVLTPPLHPNCFCTIEPVLQSDDVTDFDGQFKGDSQ